MRNFAENPPSDQVKMLWRARSISETARKGYLFSGSPHAVEASTWVRRALAGGKLASLARELRDLAANYYPDEIRLRARFAILALAIEAILARRPARARKAPRAAAEPARKPRRRGPTKVDNVYRGQPDACPECGKEFKREGRAWSIKVHCSAKCKNRAWARKNPRKAVA